CARRWDGGWYFDVW
nr:immunoglobulin heavy chain junction region [Mus musculus]